MPMSFGEFRALVRADFAVNEPPSHRLTVLIWRFGQYASSHPGRSMMLARALYFVADHVWVRSMVGAELPAEVRPGPGICLKHTGRGIILFPTVQIGANVVIYHDVTLGVRDFRPNAAPILEDGAYVGAGAKVIGGVRLGAGCKVGANAVVLHDVPAGASVAGVPARLIEKPAQGDNPEAADAT